MIEDSGMVQNKKIYELTEIYDERNGLSRNTPDVKKSQPVIVVDGRGYERVRSDADPIHDLIEVVDDNLLSFQINDAVMKRAGEIIEEIAREVIPDIAERVIREEIEKIKAMYKNHSSGRD
jgi:hypothetical protein